jgi:hypothetical protein
MLRDLCDQHPDMKVTHEFESFLGLGVPCNAYIFRMLSVWKRKGILRYRICRYPGVANSRWARGYVLKGHLFTARYLLKMLEYRNRTIDALAVEEVLRSIFPKARIVGDKWPDYVNHLDKLTQMDGIFNVIIYRDCRDVASSTLKLVRTTWREQAWTENANTAAKVAGRWVRAIETMERYKDRIYAIRYEDLVEDPKKHLKPFGQWLGVAPQGFHHEMVRDSSVGLHKKGLTISELEEIETVAGPTMARLGYI